jgi:hypothetical protein
MAVCYGHAISNRVVLTHRIRFDKKMQPVWLITFLKKPTNTINHVLVLRGDGGAGEHKRGERDRKPQSVH